MSELTPTRSVVLELRDERRAMRDGYVFLDEKCLLLAAEILHELAHHEALQKSFLAIHATAMASLRAAVARHGLHGLQVYPAADLAAAQVRSAPRALMGVRLQDAAWEAEGLPAPPAVDASPEAEACRHAFATVLEAAVPLAAVTGNLERLANEYRRSLRRARALQDVLLPELDRDLNEIENRLEELEQEEAVWVRRSY